MTRLILLAALAGSLLFAPMAASQTAGYIPLQAAHSGNWALPGPTGEGLDVRVFLADTGEPVVFVQTYLLPGDGARWYSAIERTGEAQAGPGRYLLRVFQRPAPGGDPAVVGSAEIWTTWGGQLGLLLVIDDGAQVHTREGLLTRVTPQNGALGRCGQATFFPAPGPADPVWCHD